MFTNKTRVIDASQFKQVPKDILALDYPVILKGLVKQWPLVQLGGQSDLKAIEHLKAAYSGLPLITYHAEGKKQGRYFYQDNVTTFDFTKQTQQMDEVFDQIINRFDDAEPDSIFMPSVLLERYLPSIKSSHLLDIEGVKPYLVQAWMGSPSVVSCHLDTLNNIACCVVGKRRFTLFPPNQIENLFIGPVDNTPAGQAISMVDFNEPNFEKYPRFKEAIASAQVAEMEPGDALFLPSLWWHHVEGLSRFNVMINYWWRNTPSYIAEGMSALEHAILSIRDLPECEKKGWKALFDYYVFNDASIPTAHLPQGSQGILAPIDDVSARKIRAKLLNSLNR